MKWCGCHYLFASHYLYVKCVPRQNNSNNNNKSANKLDICRIVGNGYSQARLFLLLEMATTLILGLQLTLASGEQSNSLYI